MKDKRLTINVAIEEIDTTSKDNWRNIKSFGKSIRFSGDLIKDDKERISKEIGTLFSNIFQILFLKKGEIINLIMRK